MTVERSNGALQLGGRRYRLVETQISDTKRPFCIIHDSLYSVHLVVFVFVVSVTSKG